MKTTIPMTRVLILICLSAFCLFSLGCAGSKKSGTQLSAKETTAIYYEFEDVLVPKDMKIVEDSTVVVSTPGYTSGILTLKGRVKKSSLFHFFNNNMLKDNWNMVSHIKSPASFILIFKKKGRWAVITIREKLYYTYVEIGVAPTTSSNTAAPGSNLFD